MKKFRSVESLILFSSRKLTLLCALGLLALCWNCVLTTPAPAQSADELKLGALLPQTTAELSEGVLYAPTIDFTAKAIRPKCAKLPGQNVWQAYRKTFELASVPKQALCRIATDSRYWLFVNGKRVVQEGGLKRGPNPNACYFDVVDLGPFLREGKNEIAALVWFWGKEGFSHKNSGKVGFLLDATCNGKGGLFLETGTDWKAAVLTETEDGAELGVSQPFAASVADPQPNFRLPESHIRFDARKCPGNWTAEGFNDSAWPAAEVIEGEADSVWGPLYQRPFKGWKFGEIQPYAKVSESVKDGVKTVIGRLPFNQHQSPWFRVEAKGGEVMTLKTDSYLVGDACTLRFEYVCRDGVQEFEFPEWLSGNQVEMTMPESVQVLETGYRPSGFPTEFTGMLECDDAFYGRLYDKAQKTLYVTMRDTYMDCPDRERALWWGDAVNELGEAFYALDREADLLSKKGFYELMRFQKPDGVIFAPIPAGNWEKELPAQMLATVSTFGLGTYALYSGDEALTLDLYPRTLRYLALWEFDEEGVIRVRHGGWSWADWGDDIDLRLILNAWYSLALDQAIQTGERILALQKPTDSDAKLAALLRENPSLASLNVEAVLKVLYAQRETLRKNFNRVFWTGTCYRSPDYQNATDDRSNAMAYLAGFATPEMVPALREVLVKEEHASPYMEKYVLEALFRMGFDADALDRMKRRYSEMINSDEFTTLWEGWGHGNIVRGTFNHAWSGGGLTCLIQYAVGLTPTKAAFQEFTVQPQMGSLKRLATTVETHFGMIRVALTQETPGSIELKLTVPQGTTATVPGAVGKKVFGAGEWTISISK